MNKPVFTFLAALAAAACNSAPPEPVTQPGPQLDAAAAPAEEAPELRAEDLEHSEGADAQAPFVLTLDGPKSLPEGGGLVTLTAKLDAPRSIDAPTTITISLPPGSSLQKGVESEKLTAMPQGGLERVFEVMVPADFDRDQPIEVAVNLVHPTKKFGAHAKRQYPEALATAKPSTRVPRPPVGRPIGESGKMPPVRREGAPSMPGTR